MKTDFEEVIEPNKAQKLTNLVSNIIIKIKQYFKELKEGW
jgi:hypothetical protein